MKTIREWGFPAVLICTWMIVTAYTVSLTIDTRGWIQPSAPPAPASTPVS